jgi:SAM-dependent methyltransferase
MARKLFYVAGEKDPLYLHALRNRFLRTPNVIVCQMDPENPADFAQWLDQDDAKKFDTALCVNVLETAEEPAAVLRSLHGCLKDGGNVVVLVPQGKGLYGSLDRALGHKQRFSAGELGGLLEEAGFRVEQTRQLNKIGAVSWWIFGKLLGRKKIAKAPLKLFDKTVWIWRRIDGIMPWRGLSLIVIARRTNTPA